MLIYFRKKRDHRNTAEGIDERREFEYDRYIILNLRKPVEGKHLILAGCGHAHLTTLMNIRHLVDKGHRVSVIGPSPYHYYSGMGPGMLGGSYRPREIRFNIQKAALERGASFIIDRVSKIDADARRLELASGQQLDYDVVSFNVGSYIPLDFLDARPAKTFTAKPIDNLYNLRKFIQSADPARTTKIRVIGGGPAGVELAGNMERLVRTAGKKADISLLTGGEVLSRFPEKARALALKSFRRRGIDVIEQTYVNGFDGTRLSTRDGQKLEADIALFALGIRPSPIFTRSGLPTDSEGALLVDRCLRSVSHPHIFGGGDCINLTDTPLDKVGVYAVRQNPILLNNLTAALEGNPMQTFTGEGPYLLIFNLGNDRAIFWKGRFVWSGKLAFRLKDSIDRRFMKKYQVSGETDE